MPSTSRRYRPSETVTIDDVMEADPGPDDAAFVIDIETDSTILVDEQAEKEARAEFLTAFSTATQAVQPLLWRARQAPLFAGGMLKFALGPFRAGRELDGLIDDFVDKAPQALAQQQGGEAEKALAEANQKLADAEMQKAQAQTAKVQVDAQGKMQELQLKLAEAQGKGPRRTAKGWRRNPDASGQARGAGRQDQSHAGADGRNPQQDRPRCPQAEP